MVNQQGQTFIFFGIVGSGKGTQVKLLKEALEKNGGECVYIGTGEIFRKILASSDNNAETKIIKDILLSGRLMPDEETNKAVERELNSNEPLQNKIIIFDGYPRTLAQSEVFESMMSLHTRNSIKIIYLELSKDEAIRRMKLRGREDDTDEGIAKRFDEYANKVIPAMEYFENKMNYQILRINGEQSIEEVQKEILTKLNL